MMTAFAFVGQTAQAGAVLTQINPAGPAGAAGPAGPPGASGASTLSGITDATSAFRALNVADPADQRKAMGAASAADLAALAQATVNAIIEALNPDTPTASWYTAVSDADFPVQTANVYVAMRTLTAPRTFTLPSAAAYPAGQALYLADESGACSPTLLITVAAAGSNTIAGQASVTMGSPYQKLTFHSNGANLWTVA